MKLDYCDVAIVLGMGFLAYGLYMFRPWISFVVVGLMFIVIGALTDILGDRKDGSSRKVD